MKKQHMQVYLLAPVALVALWFIRFVQADGAELSEYFELKKI